MAGVFLGVCEWPRRPRASRRVAWSCEFSSSMGAGMWSPRTPRTRRACLGLLRDRTRSYEASLPGRGRRGASIVTVDPGARASTGGRSILNFDARRSVLLCCCRRTERERVERPVLLDRARLWTWWIPATLHGFPSPVRVPSSKIKCKVVLSAATHADTTNHAEHQHTTVHSDERTWNKAYHASEQRHSTMHSTLEYDHMAPTSIKS